MLRRVLLKQGLCKSSTTKTTSKHSHVLSRSSSKLFIPFSSTNASLRFYSNQSPTTQQERSSTEIQQEGEQSNVKEVKKASVKTQFQILKRIMQYAKPEAKLLSIAMVGLIVSTAISLMFPYGIGMLVDAINIPDKSEATQTLKTVGYGLTGLFAIAGVAVITRVSAVQIAGQRIARQMRNQLFSQIVKQDVQFFDKAKTGELVNRLSTDVTVVSDTLTITIISGLRSFVEAIGGIALLFYLSTKLTFAAVSVFPAIGIGAVVYGRYVRKLNKDYMDALADSTSLAQEKISSIRAVRLFAAELREISRYDDKIKHVYEIGKKLGIARGAFYSGVYTATNFAMLGVLVFGGLSVINGTLTVGSLTSFLIYSVYVGASFTNLSSLYGDIMKAIGSSERMFEILDQRPAIPIEGGIKLDSIRGDISFKNVQFAYPTRKEVNILNEFSLEISAGDSVAIVGESGSGKSTIASLISRLYDVDNGSISIDGHDIRSFDPSWLRDNIGVVSQEPVIFDMSIRNNIAYGCNRPVTEEEILEAAKLAHADIFIDELPEGFDTLVGERGVTLSGGQKQRLAIARVLLKNPKILILDESTSSLDAKSESLIQDTVEKLMNSRTTIVIAHRLSTIQSAKKIVVLDKGHVSEIGSHQTLFNSNGRYKDLVLRQMTAWQKGSTASSE